MVCAASGFNYESLQQEASLLAQKAFEAPAPDAKVDNLDYDAYRKIQFRRERTIWRNEGLGVELQVLPTGWGTIYLTEQTHASR